MRTKRMVDGKGEAFELGKVFRFGCCECGLTHDMVIVIDPKEPGLFGLAIKRNNRATAARRRHINQKP